VESSSLKQTIHPNHKEGRENFLSGERKFSPAPLQTFGPFPPLHTYTKRGKLPLGREEVFPNALTKVWAFPPSHIHEGEFPLGREEVFPRALTIYWPFPTMKQTRGGNFLSAERKFSLAPAQPVTILMVTQRFYHANMIS